MYSAGYILSVNKGLFPNSGQVSCKARVNFAREKNKHLWLLDYCLETEQESLTAEIDFFLLGVYKN